MVIARPRPSRDERRRRSARRSAKALAERFRRAVAWHRPCIFAGNMDDDPNIRWRRTVAAPVATDPFTPESSRTNVEIAASSVCGLLRADNTDHYLAIRLGRLQETLRTSLPAADLPPRFEEYAYAMIVADGLGDRNSG